MEIDAKGNFVEQIVVPPEIFRHIRLFGRDVFDEATQRDIVLNSVYGHILTASIKLHTKADFIKFVCTKLEDGVKPFDLHNYENIKVSADEVDKSVADLGNYGKFFAKYFAKFEKEKESLIRYLIVSPKILMELRKMGYEFFDQGSIREIKETRLYGHIFAADVTMDRLLDGIVFVLQKLEN